MQLDELVEAFELLPDWEERYRILIDLGRKLPEFPDAERTEENRVQGCTSKVWLIAEKNGEVLDFRADSDSFIVKGLLAILLKAYSGQRPEDIQRTDIEDLFQRLGLEQNLSPNRRSGFYATVERIKAIAARAA